MYLIVFGRWCHKAGMFFSYDRVYLKYHKWTPFCKVYPRYRDTYKLHTGESVIKTIDAYPVTLKVSRKIPDDSISVKALREEVLKSEMLRELLLECDKRGYVTYTNHKEYDPAIGMESQVIIAKLTVVKE